MADQISKTLLQQRIRNRLIEYFEWASSFETIASFGAFETINSWEDWVHSSELSFFHEPVFSPDEHDAITAFYKIWDAAAEATKEDVFDQAELRWRDPWVLFVETAAAALETFLQRGRFSEEEEEFGGV